MKHVPIAIVAVLAALVSIPFHAQAQDRSKWFDPYERAYLRAYERAHDAGHYLGRNLVDDDLKSGRVPSKARIEEDTAQIKALLRPVVQPTVTTAPVEPAYSAPAPVSETSGSGCPASMAPESGSAGYSAYNPSSGATGCYQVIPSTAAAFDCDLSTPTGQDACAARICEGQGSSAWAASGANPC